MGSSGGPEAYLIAFVVVLLGMRRKLTLGTSTGPAIGVAGSNGQLIASDSRCIGMKKELRDKFYGQTVEEWIEKIPGELPIDAVGLWQIVPFAREGFGLSGEELLDVVRRSITALLAKGAVPVVGAMDGVHFWTPVIPNPSN